MTLAVLHDRAGNPLGIAGVLFALAAVVALVGALVATWRNRR